MEPRPSTTTGAEPPLLPPLERGPGAGGAHGVVAAQHLCGFCDGLPDSAPSLWQDIGIGRADDPRAAGRPESMVGRQAAQPWLATIGLI